MECTVRESRPLKISENVYWISAAAAARYPRGGGRSAQAWCRLPHPRRDRAMRYADLVPQAKAVALEVAVELQEFVRTRLPLTVGLALISGMLSAGMLSLL